MMTSRRDVEVAPGFTFTPQHKDLTDLYLRRKIVGEPLPGATGLFIHEADVYSAEPEQLVSTFQKAPGTGNGEKQPVWYFFSRVRHPSGRKKKARGGATRKPRTIEGVVGKHWHSEHRAKPVEGGSAVGGYMQDFSYCTVKRSESGKKKNVRLGWVMYEYGISEEHGGGDLVLCKILPSDRTGRKETTAAVSTTISPNKRKRNAGGHPEDTTASARPRHTVDQDQHPHPLPAEILRSASATTTEDAEDYHRHTHTSADETLFNATETELDNLRHHHHMAFEQGVYKWYGSGDPVPDTAVAQVQAMDPGNFLDNVDGFYQNNVVMVWPGGHLAMAPAAQPEVQEMPLPSNFFHNVEQEFPSLYHNNDGITVGPAGGDVVAPPAAQPEEEAAGLVQSIITADRNDQNHQMEMEMEEGTEPGPKEPAADVVIYGLPCPAFSPEMIRICSMMPWSPSPTSMAAILSGL